MEKKYILILDSLRSVYNTASLFRTADGAGFSEIFLCGTTPCPVDRFGRNRKDFAKVALGAENSVPWKYFETTFKAIEHARKEGFEIVALEQNPFSVLYTKFTPQKNTALVLGEETQGLGQDVLGLCDVVLEIPMRGKKESLNVSSAGTVAMYRLTQE